jgi:transcriptional regulator with XRE-family HTH domain
MIKGLPDKLRELRKKYQMSQREVAHRINVSPATIAAYETGERTPSTQNIISFSELFHCSTDYLLKNAQEPECVLIDTKGLTEKQTRLLMEFIETMR